MTWQDDHVSQFDVDWLCARNFTLENQKQYLDKHYRPQPELWSKSQFELKEFQASDVFDTDDGKIELFVYVTFLLLLLINKYHLRFIWIFGEIITIWSDYHKECPIDRRPMQEIVQSCWFHSRNALRKRIRRAR